MAEIVAVYAVPHTPSFVAEVLQNGDRSETAQLFATIRRHLASVRANLIVTVNNDHFNTFFLDNLPTFAIGLADRTAGPNDQTPGMPWYEVEVDAEAAASLQRNFLNDGFDFSSTQEFQIDHGALVPLHFMTPKMDLPIVPVFVNCVVPPLPSASRCYSLGRSLAKGILALSGRHEASRVAIVTSGSLSLEIGGPRAFVGKTFGVPDPDWATWILDCVKSKDHQALIDAATEARMLEAGNVAGELLNWMIALGAVGRSSPDILISQPELGNAFAAWSVGAQS
ncbi:hypothetical protein [Bradyrhizobium elkanii]|uniref:DODA-type extradiol aromatic ring-opening family dioxygenase n=1 Tax=Bradyrhizobium elkanii TaxID=29448 RepID=UPI0004B33237|nr:hypothetical protein [Bradyrhizobium elkanii]